jgi:DNA-binding transcriptional LysR family regulator
MDARKLAHFIAVAEHGSFTKAAEALHIAQPSLSQSIRALEQELGTPLFHRLPRSLELSSAGKALVTPARRALRAMQDAREAVRAVSELQAGHLDLTVPRALAVHPTATVVAAFRERYPRVDVTVTEAIDSGDAAERVRTGAAECGILELSVEPRGLTITPLVDFELFVALPPGMTAPAQDVLTPAFLRDVPVVAFPRGTVTRRIVDDAGAEVAVEVRSPQALVELVVAGVGAALMVEPHARHAADRGAQVLPLSPAMVHRVGLATTETEPAPAVREFVRVALATLVPAATASG